MMENILITPKNDITIPLFGGFQISETVITMWIVSLIIIAFAAIFRLFLFKRFKEHPKGFQNAIEICVEGINKFSIGHLGEHGASIAAYVFSIAAILVISGLVELFGVRAPATDINFTASIAIMSFVLIFALGIRYKGVRGFLKAYSKPMIFMVPIKLLTDIAKPVSLASRMFGNMFSGLVCMDLVYGAMKYFAVGIPAFLALYFNLFHVGMQTFIFLTLTLSFINEAVE
jgi:F-type H+-transporting ATPase subunit a